MTPTKGFRVYQAKGGRRFIDAANVAEIAGVPVMFFNDHAWPAGWAEGRDYVTEVGRVWFALVSLPRFADWLQQHGQPDGALKLREWATAWIETAMAKEIGRQPVSERAASRSEVMGHGSGVTTTALARNSWAKEWEESH